MASETTARVKRHRLVRGVVRVEVEVPSAEDALAVRQFARNRREAIRRPTPVHQGAGPPQPATDGLEATLASLDAPARAVAERFVAALARAATPALVQRAAGMAAILEDAAGRLAAIAALDRLVGADAQEGRGK